MGIFNFGLRKDIKEKLEKNKPLFYVPTQHIAGLPLPQYELVQIYCYANNIEIANETQTFLLNMEQIQDICIKTNVEIQKHMISSTGGAIAGAMLFGVVGAVIGGKPKGKTTRNVDRQLIINYISDSKESKYIGFSVTANYEADKMVDWFNTIKPKESIVKL